MKKNSSRNFRVYIRILRFSFEFRNFCSNFNTINSSWPQFIRTWNLLLRIITIRIKKIQFEFATFSNHNGRFWVIWQGKILKIAHFISIIYEYQEICVLSEFFGFIRKIAVLSKNLRFFLENYVFQDICVLSRNFLKIKKFSNYQENYDFYAINFRDKK